LYKADDARAKKKIRLKMGGKGVSSKWGRAALLSLKA